MKVLNLYSGIGGNRRLWQDVEVTAVELREDIAAVYRHYFPQDEVIVGDAHEYLLKHYHEYDFIWSSPPCPTHSNARFWSSKGGMYDVMYPDMSLYQEIIFLKHFFGGDYVVENVVPYYEPLYPGKKIGRHLFWSNFTISTIESESNYIFSGSDTVRVEQMLGFENLKIKNKIKILRNCVHPETGLHILNCARGIMNRPDSKQMQLPLTA